jgi:putative transcriptional regulator
MSDNKVFDDIMEGLREAIAHAKGEKKLIVHEFPDLDVAAVRSKTKLSQGDFARTFGVAVGTLRGWEQNRRKPVGPARVLLTLIDREPATVLRTLIDAPKRSAKPTPRRARHQDRKAG